MIPYQATNRSNKGSFSLNISTDGCLKTIITEINNDSFPKCEIRSTGKQIAKKVRTKKEHNIKMLP